MNWNFLDIIFTIIMVFLALRGLIRGFIGEIFSVGAVVVGVGAAVFFSAALAPAVEKALGLESWGQIIAFLGIFIVAYLVMKLTEKALRGVVENINLQNLDKAMGFFLGIVEGTVVVALLVFVLRIQPLFDFSAFLGGSVLARLLSPLAAFGERTFSGKM